MRAAGGRIGAGGGDRPTAGRVAAAFAAQVRSRLARCPADGPPAETVVLRPPAPVTVRVSPVDGRVTYAPRIALAVRFDGPAGEARPPVRGPVVVPGAERVVVRLAERTVRHETVVPATRIDEPVDIPGRPPGAMPLPADAVFRSVRRLFAEDLVVRRPAGPPAPADVPRPSAGPEEVAVPAAGPERRFGPPAPAPGPDLGLITDHVIRALYRRTTAARERVRGGARAAR